MRKLLAIIFVLLLTKFVFSQIQVTNASISGNLYGIEHDDTYNRDTYNVNGAIVGGQNGYDFYAVCIIDLSQLGGMAKNVTSGSITLQFNGSNDASQWTFGYIGDVSNENYSQQVNAIMQINANWTNDSQPLTLPISSWNIQNNKLTIGVLKKIVNNHETGSPQLVYYSSGSITATIDRSVTLIVTYNQGSGNIVAYVNGAYNAPSAPAQTMGYETDQITIGALSPTIPNYILAYNENQAPLNKSAWWIYDQNYQRQTQTLASATNTFSMQYSQDNWTYEAQMKKLCNITLQNNFIGVGHGGVITVNGNQVNSPSSNNMVVEQNAISATVTGTEINGIYYNLSNWTDANNNIISTNNSATFYPGNNMTYTANYIGSPASNTISMGYNIVVGQPITMHWTDNPNSNVTYQIWRNIKGGSGAVLIATHLTLQQ